MWTVAGGISASKPRPAIIVQDDVFELTDSITVAPLTTTLVDAPLLRLRVPAGGLTGLAQDSDVMVDKLTTVRRSNVQVRIGRLSRQQMVELERLLMTFLGMAR
ncbi:type II toxin-antitoxin system PemK/MazF family toxin [Tessaracoccus defluvii]